MNPEDPFGLLGPPKRSNDDPLGLLGPKPAPVAQSDVTATEPYKIRPKDRPIKDATPDPLAQRITETFVSGLPGAQRAVSGYRGLLSLMGVGDETPEEALAQQKNNVATMPWKARAPLQFAGALPAAEFLAPLGVAGGGAAFGAAAGADQPAESFGQRARNTTFGAALGVTGAKLGVAATKGLGNIATRTGLTDQIGKAINRVSPKIASTMGTRGQVNSVLAERQDILDAIGANPTNPGKRVLSQIEATQTRARKLYGIARQDKRPIENPELNQLLNDPQVKRAYQIAAQIREVSGNPLPTRDATLAEMPAPKITPTSQRPVKIIPGNGAGAEAPKTRAPNRKAAEGAVNPKYRLDDDEKLMNRAAELSARLQEYSEGTHGPPGWVRGNAPATGRSDASPSGGKNYTGYLDHPVSGGTHVDVRMRQDKQLYDEAVAELRARGWPEADVLDEIASRPGTDIPASAPTPTQPAQAVVPKPAVPGTSLVLAKPPQVDVPDPQVLSSLKRYLSHAAEGNMKSKFPVRQEEALALLPKLQRIREILHETSPAWKQADAFFADAKGQEEAFAHGFDAMRHANSAVGAKLKTQSPEAMLQAIEEPRYAGEPRAAMKARAEAFREGVKAFMAEQVRGTTVDHGLESLLGKKALEGTPKAAQVRSLMFENPEKANALENLLSDKRGEFLAHGRPKDTPIQGKSGIVRTIARPFTKPDLLKTSKGQMRLSDVLRSPTLNGSENAYFKGGMEASKYLRDLLGIAAGGQLAR